MDKGKLEDLLRKMLADLQRLSTKANRLGQFLKEINFRIVELQHAIARIAYHNKVDPFISPHAGPRPTRSRRKQQ